MAPTETTPDKGSSEIELKLKRAMGNVLPASGGQDTSLISSDPFKYSQLGLITSNSINDALSQIHGDVQDTLSKVQLGENQLLKSINDEIKLQRRKLMEQTKISISKELKRIAEEIGKQSNTFAQQDIHNQIRKQIEDQQKNLVEQTKISIREEMLKKKLIKNLKREIYY